MAGVATSRTEPRVPRSQGSAFRRAAASVSGPNPDPDDAARQVELLEERMEEAAENLESELAADIRDRIRDLREEFDLAGGDADDRDGVAPERDPEF